MNAEDAQTQLIEEFAKITSWENKYAHIIALGKALPTYPEEHRNDDYKVKGCLSQVWLHPVLQDTKIHFRGDSDALIVKGLVAILLRIYSNRTPEQILSTKPEFISHLGLAEHLSPSRANGLNSVLKQIHYYALAFQALTLK